MKRGIHPTLVALLIGVLTIAAAPDSLLAQDTTSSFPRNAIYVEGLGQGLLYSVNYDHLFTRHWDFRVGFASWAITPFFFFSSGKTKFTGVPLLVNYIVGGSVNHLELGIGAVVGFTSTRGRLWWGSDYSSSGSAFLGTATIAYRGETPGGGPMVRLAFTPFFTFKRIEPYGGISLGFCF